MVFAWSKSKEEDFPETSETSRETITRLYRADEKTCVKSLLALIPWDEERSTHIQETARFLVQGVRTLPRDASFLTDFLTAYGLSSQEGIVLMCLSEALLRIPDALTSNLIIQDKLAKADISFEMKKSGSFIVNASTLALRFVNNFFACDNSWALKDKDIEEIRGSFWGIFGRMIVRCGEPVIRQAIRHAIRLLGNQFIIGETIEEALRESEIYHAQGYLFSYDMLGESAHTAEDAELYFQAYRTAMLHLIQQQTSAGDPAHTPGLSIKLSALTPRFDEFQATKVRATIVPRLRELAHLAANAGLCLTIDAEEARHLDMTLDIVEDVSGDPSLARWHGLGIAVQAYQKRAPAVIDWLADMARRHQRRLIVRLVKGAYWDGEIKRAQVEGFEDYPVYTRKVYTDVAYLACAQKLFQEKGTLYPQFATHNAYTLAAIKHLASGNQEYEVQKLFGMGDDLYHAALKQGILDVPCRIYAPVGQYRELLPYLVRRLLENGANSSFLHYLYDSSITPEQLTIDPVKRTQELGGERAPYLPLPVDIFGSERANSSGIDLTDRRLFHTFQAQVHMAQLKQVKATSLVHGRPLAGTVQEVRSPVQTTRVVGTYVATDAAGAAQAIEVAGLAFAKWDNTPAEERAVCLEKMAYLLEKEYPRLVSLLIYEAGKTYADAVAEVRESVDFCRYYAAQGRALFKEPRVLKSPTGEYNQHTLAGRGVFVCISPWNFPLAIFVGQVAAALVVGNSVVAKPAEQTPLIAYEAVHLFHQAGIPQHVLHLVLGRGSELGAAMIEHEHTAGVALTGSMETAQKINRMLSARPGAIVPFIAETGGLNAMIVDSSALLEQVVSDVIDSAFKSAGQRCSCLRVLYVQEEIADSLISMLSGAMRELVVGDPSQLSTDVGPVIGKQALTMLQEHTRFLEERAKLLATTPLPVTIGEGFYFPPHLYELPAASLVTREVFGPILHLVRFNAQNLAEVLYNINNTGYGLTLGIHSRIDHTVDFIRKRVRVGNVYVNRNMVGAVVGVQPFGGEGLSGTGPKAGGPYYLLRFGTERVLTINTTAVGGNVDLVCMKELSLPYGS